MILWFGLAPWVLCLELVLYFGLVILVELEFYGWSTTLLIVGLVASHYFHVFSIVDIFKHHFVGLLTCVLVYFPAGSIWMVFKWLLFLHKFNDARQDALEEFHERQRAAKDRIAANSPYSMDEDLLKETDREHLAHKSYERTPLFRSPRIRDYKAKATGWVCFWVFSVVGTLFHDIARRISLWIYNRFSGLLQWMSDRVVGDLPEPPNP
jgi:hypothetical protein